MPKRKAPIAYDWKNIYPKTRKVREIISADVSSLPKDGPPRRPGGQASNEAEQVMFAVLQGLVNRAEPRVYLRYYDHDRRWVDYYNERFEIPVTHLKSPYELLDLFADCVEGVIVYDPKMPDTLHLAAMLCARHNCLPVTARRQRELRKQYPWVANVVDDLRGRFANEYELNLWTHKNLQPDCNRHIVVHQRGVTPLTYDYIVAHNLYVFHACHSMKDRKEAALADSVYQAMDRPGHVMGWLDERVVEIEYTARIARNGCFETCNACPNLSLHAGIAARPKLPRRKLTTARKTAEKKVYVSFVFSDGDALWCLNGFFFGNFNHPLRGEAPAAWETQILDYHLAPGVLQYYVDHLSPNDTLIASTSGAGYTYPNLHPDPASYLKFTDKYMKLTGVRHVFAGIHNPYQTLYWGDAESQRLALVDAYRQHVPAAQGVYRGYGGQGLLEQHSVEPGQTPFVCFTGKASKAEEILAVVQEATGSVPHRPLFISLHLTNTQGSVPEALCEAAKTLEAQGCEIVLPDEWFAKMRSASRKGWLDGGLYPNRDELIADRQDKAVAHWRGGLEKTFAEVLTRSLLPNARLAKLPPKRFPAIWGAGQPGNEPKRTATTLADDLSFSVLFTAQVLAGLVADCHGYYCKDLAELRRFCRSKLRHIADGKVLAECLTAWLRWDTKRVSIAQAKAWARRLLKLLPRISQSLYSLVK